MEPLSRSHMMLPQSAIVTAPEPTSASPQSGTAGSSRALVVLEPLTEVQEKLLVEKGVHIAPGKGKRPAEGGWSGLVRTIDFQYSDGSSRDGTIMKRQFTNLINRSRTSTVVIPDKV